jgi:acyl carrier protein
MIPSSIIRLRALPLTASGKIDRAALPKSERPSLDHDAEAVRGPVEERIAAIWSEVLGVQDLGPNENFFELGGHSLLVTRVNSQLRACFGIEISLRTLFDNPTISELSEIIESARPPRQGAPSGLPDGALREEALF